MTNNAFVWLGGPRGHARMTDRIADASIASTVGRDWWANNQRAPNRPCRTNPGVPGEAFVLTRRQRGEQAPLAGWMSPEVSHLSAWLTAGSMFWGAVAVGSPVLDPSDGDAHHTRWRACGQCSWVREGDGLGGYLFGA